MKQKSLSQHVSQQSQSRITQLPSSSLASSRNSLTSRCISPDPLRITRSLSRRPDPATQYYVQSKAQVFVKANYKQFVSTQQRNHPLNGGVTDYQSINSKHENSAATTLQNNKDSPLQNNFFSKDAEQSQQLIRRDASHSPLKQFRSTYHSPTVTAQTDRQNSMSNSEKRIFMKRMKKIEEDVQVLNLLRSSNTNIWREFQPKESDLRLISERSTDLLQNLKAKENSIRTSKEYRFDKLVDKRLRRERLQGDLYRTRMGQNQIEQNRRELENDRAEMNKKMLDVASDFVGDINLYNKVFCSALDYPNNPNKIPDKELKIQKGYILEQNLRPPMHSQSTPNIHSDEIVKSSRQDEQQQIPTAVIGMISRSRIPSTHGNSVLELKTMSGFSGTERQHQQRSSNQISPKQKQKYQQLAQASGQQGIGATGSTMTDVIGSMPGIPTVRPKTQQTTLQEQYMRKRTSQRFKDIGVKMEAESGELREGINTFRDLFKPIHTSLMSQLKSMEALVQPNQDDFFNKIRLNRPQNNYLAEIEKLVLRFPSLVHAGDSTQCTGLHWAAKRNCAPLAVLLLRHGAKKDVIDQLGRTPLSIAQQAEHFEVYKLLISS